ncbi:MAG: AtpZ/AtpI family protein [Alphaproteobacteria bacterium]|nr:AtpZ/AtpI family protein [Alphaproteobacteria bacterium]MBO7536934.1 AtpZ/AtpI family protein [Alphaproteobacteria bacterium]MBO7641996.1 AtpZ/AtpI family protein [Alphaproteobacteria bacterium]MCR4623191.1 AtpZ/AtpI family protein [Alphaproteobacteria bacterium]
MDKRNCLIKSINCGLEFTSCIIVGVFVGIFIDKKVQCFPLFLVIFLILGCIAGYFNMMRYIEKNR